MSTNERATVHQRHSSEEITWARWRPERHRPPIPTTGDRVLYRGEAWAEPVGATVLEVQDPWPKVDGDEMDWNCLRVRVDPSTATPVYGDSGKMILDLHPDWWPTLLLKVDGLVSHVQTREARLRGSAGWLPLDWERRERPVPGGEMPR